jgi:hypothetical protein
MLDMRRRETPFIAGEERVDPWNIPWNPSNGRIKPPFRYVEFAQYPDNRLWDVGWRKPA